MVINKKNNYPPLFFRITLLWLLPLFFTKVQAQEQDTAINQQEEQIVQAEDTSLSQKEEDNKDYFLKKGNSPDGNFFIQERRLPASRVKEMQEDKDFWYANATVKKQQEKKENKNGDYISLGQRTWFQTLLWLVIIGAFAAFLMIYLTGANVSLFRKKNQAAMPEEEETITEDIFAINYQKEIDKAIAAENYRLAVRLHFLKMLKTMAGKNIIHYQQDKTNLDYLLQLYPTAYYNNFFSITRNYEYTWYGHFEIGENAYKVIRHDIDYFEKSLS